MAAIAASAITAVASPAVAGVGPVRVSVQVADAAVLSFTPDVVKVAGGYSVGYSGPGCAVACVDPSVPGTASWSLDVQDLTAGTPSVNLKQGSGNSVQAGDPLVFPTPGGADGTWRVTLTFTDGANSWASSTLVDYGAGAAAPGGSTVSVDRSPVPVGEQVTFTASGSHVAAGSSKWQLLVDYGDGNKATIDVSGSAGAATFQHAFAAVPGGVWIATSDGVNQSPWVAVPVSVTTVDPKLSVAPLSGSASPLSPLTVTLDASASTTAAVGGSITKYEFNCGGVTPLVVAPAKATCTYTAAGAYPVSVTVTDSAGAVLATAPQVVNVGAGAPYLPPNLLQFTVAPDVKPLSVVADLSHVVLDPHADPAKAQYTVDWGDGHSQTFTKATLPADGRVSYTYASADTYNVQLTVDDKLGQGDPKSATVRVTVAAPPKGPTVVARVSGSDRYDTGVHVSRQRWADVADTTVPAQLHPDSVVLATGGGFADALAGVPFSVYKNGAMLLTEPNQLTGEVRDEIKRILPADGKHTVYVLGGTAALSPAVANALTGLGYHVQRIFGADRYGTALAIAHAMGDPADTVVARGDDFADALTAGPLAADVFGTGAGANYVPAAILLTDGKVVDANTKDYLHKRFVAAHGLSVIAVGGGAAQALTTVPGFDGTSANRNSGQLSGNDRFATARKVADVFKIADDKAPVGVATGMAFPDALTGGAFMASIGGPLLLTDPQEASSPMIGALAERTGIIDDVFVFGGPNAVAPGVFNSVVATVRGVAKQY
ncbi:cell wall-binding repeat-containing protein [Catenulispora yoronensis]|uniref:cell wall-binding repeat-containing protein n=1 Tax=Catenulispora yoronensis TaxID=450799 RepID=UPI0031E05AE4